MKKIVALILALCLVLSFSGTKAAERKLIATRAVAVSDTHIILEFSEPIAVHKLGGKDPWVSLRAVKPGGGSPQSTEEKTVLQWQISLKYLDSKHDRLLGTLTGKALGMTTIADILNWKGELAQYADRGWEIRLVIEECDGTNDGGKDGLVCNITTVDGAVNLTAVSSSDYESARLSVEEDYTYAYSTAKSELLHPEEVNQVKPQVLTYPEGALYAKRAVQVSSTQIVVEFSEPVAFALLQSQGPYIAIRLTTKNGSGATRTDDGASYIQWLCNAQYLDSGHDRLLLTLNGALGVNTIDGIRNYEGVLADYSERGWEMRLVIEEYPDDKVNYSDCGVKNVTSLDGKKMLFPTNVDGYEAVSMLVERDLSYKFDPETAESTVRVAGLDANTVVMSDGADYVAEEEDDRVQTVVNTVEIKANDPIVSISLIGGGALAAVAAVGISLLVSKKRKAGK